MHQVKNKHQPVLLTQVLECLSPNTGESYVDMTAGYGGHAKAILERTKNAEQSYLVDRDQEAIAALGYLAKQGSHLIHADFLRASQQLVEQGKRFDLLLADLGVSSPHLDKASRGFGFTTDSPLDMRMDKQQQLTAETVVNSYSEAQLSDILWHFGEEPKARRIASLIVKNRPFETTQQLAKIVAKAWPGHSKIHPATRSFQAIRIVVNDELRLLEEALPLWIDLLKPRGRLVVISFHSLEDRIVKRTLADYAEGYEAEIELINKRPITGNKDELVFNPRARSAKLRAAVKIKTERE